MANGRQPGDTSGGEQLGPVHMLLFGALSGASAELVVYPMEVIRRRMQMQAASAGTPCVIIPVTAWHAEGMHMACRCKLVSGVVCHILNALMPCRCYGDASR